MYTVGLLEVKEKNILIISMCIEDLNHNNMVASRDARYELLVVLNLENFKVMCVLAMLVLFVLCLNLMSI